MRRFSYVCGLGVAIIIFSATLARAQTVAVGPYYALPSWDQKLPATTRFVVLANWDSEAVLDRETGLVWQRQPNNNISNWYAASAYCDLVATGNRRGWRLPSLVELSSLGEYQPNGAFDVPPGHPFTLYNLTAFWTESVQQRVLLSSADTFLTYIQSFGVVPPPGISVFTGLGGFHKPDQVAGAWCVRGGSAAPPAASQ